MKLTKEHIAQKFICPHRRQVDPKDFFLLAGFFSNGDSVGEDRFGASSRFSSIKDDWIPYEEQKEKVLVSPCVCKDRLGFYMPFRHFQSEKDAVVRYEEEFISWPLKIVLKNVKTEQGFFERMEAEFYVEVEK